ncbi:MAG: hypothetical protein CMJ55_08540 [Planctomycetaceae bacterium]|nr:hypothetical protein [Planctomycetaceae bacterium]
MLSLFDDYPIHQTPDPINTPASSDRDVYERYWFNGYAKTGDMYLGVGTALYPHLGIRDCGISIVVDGTQHAFHASSRAGDEPTDMTIGPFKLTIIEPMRSCKITVNENETGWAGELLFEGRTSNIEEPRHTFGRGIRKVMDTTRFTQLGRWSGWLEFHGQRYEFDRDITLGTKDRSWGIRPLAGGDRRGAPALPQAGGLFFLWAPLHFDDFCAHYQLFEDTKGRTLFSVGALLPVYDSIDALPGVEDPTVTHCRNLEHKLSFASDSRMIESVELAMTEIESGNRVSIDFEKLFTFRMKGIGYSHSEWGHGMWKDDVAIGSEQWDIADVDDTAFENQHVQHLMRVKIGGNEGIGVLEQNILGPYEPYGLEGAIRPPSAP